MVCTIRLVNTKSVANLTEADPVMAELSKRLGPVRLKPRRLPPFQSLAHAIIHQQLSGQAAGTILGRFQALFDGSRFPRPEDVIQADVERLRTAGLSRQKATYIRDLAQKTIDGAVPSLKECDSLTDAEIVERLTSIKGVGRWTVEMLLIFNQGRPDILPVHDLGVRRGFQVAYRKRKLPEPEQLERYGRKWMPYRTTAAWYLWRTADFLEGKW